MSYTSEWDEDAARRDFTINALYAAADGEIFDYTGGIQDLVAGRVRFVGDAATRIREDYLRILRLFRFHAWYGKGEMDADALRAAAEGKAGLAQLSGERIAKELLRLLECPNPAPVLRVMAASGILQRIAAAGAATAPAGAADPWRCRKSLSRPMPFCGWRRCCRMMSSAAQAVAERLEALRRRSRASGRSGARAAGNAGSYLSVREVRKRLYRIGAAAFKDRVRLQLGRGRARRQCHAMAHAAVGRR